MVEVTGLVYAYGRHIPIFDGFNWRAGAGQSWAVTGPSGCGKSTLLMLLAGLLLPISGRVSVNGMPLTEVRPGTGLILQDHGLLPWATVWQNARLGLTIHEFYGPDGRHAPRGARFDRGLHDQRVRSWLERLGIDGLAEKYPSQLSGGQRQRAAIARTLATAPDLLLMDEPFSALDAPTREDLQNLLIDLRRETPLTTVLVTHSVEEAALLGEQILVLGQPPNREPRIIENPGAGTASYRTDPAFTRTVEQIRAALGSSPHGGAA